jgi:hypothetical protein
VDPQASLGKGHPFLGAGLQPPNPPVKQGRTTRKVASLACCFGFACEMPVENGKIANAYIPSIFFKFEIQRRAARKRGDLEMLGSSPPVKTAGDLSGANQQPPYPRGGSPFALARYLSAGWAPAALGPKKKRRAPLKSSTRAIGWAVKLHPLQPTTPLLLYRT